MKTKTYRKSQNSMFLFAICVITLAVLSLAAAEALADTLMPLPPYDHTFSSPSLTRGYWFEAPTDFVITGLRVPDEVGNGIQNVEVVRFNNQIPPPSFPGTNLFVSLARFINQPSGNILAVDISVSEGDVIGILGATGIHTMRNSYGQGDFVSDIDGHPVTLTRMGMQHNLNMNTARDLWQEPGYYLARVEMWYTTVCEPPAEPNDPDPCDGAIDVPVDINLCWNGCLSTDCNLPNGGFEDGVFAPWTTVTGPGSELRPWSVTTGGTGWFGNGFPLEGAFFAQNGFDGDAGLFYDIYQEIAIPPPATSAVLNWSERIQWDMVPYGATLPRQYVVSVQPAGGGAILAVLYTMNLNPGTSGDTGYVPHSVDLLSAAPGIAGQIVRINFHEDIPEMYTGPAQFDLDGVSLSCNGAELLIDVQSTPQGSQADTPDFEVLKAKYDNIRADALAALSEEPQIDTDSSPAPPLQTLVGNSQEESAIQQAAVQERTLVESYQAQNALGNVAIFQDKSPWGSTSNEDVLTANGISYTIYSSAAMGVVDLSTYDKVIISSVQTSGFYNALEANRAWFESYVIAGGILDLHLASFQVTPVDGKVMPGGFVTDGQPGFNNVTIVDSSHPVVTTPHTITDAELDNWNYSTHGYFSIFPAGAHEILEITGSGRPCAMEFVLGSGRIFATVQTVEWYGASYEYLENTILYALIDGEPQPLLTWDVYFGTDPCSLELLPECNDICGRNCDPTPQLGETLEECIEYFWQVVAENRCGSTTEGPIWSFTTGREDESPCNRDPNCRDAVPSVTKLWAPNHKWVNIEILDVNDPDGDPVSITITSITQDEPVDGKGSGRTFPDGDGIGTSIARVRAERSGRGNGRVYEISFEADDGMGGVCSGSVNVCVPHDQSITNGGSGRQCIDDGQLYDSAAPELPRADLNNDSAINQLDFAILANYWLPSYELND